MAAPVARAFVALADISLSGIAIATLRQQRSIDIAIALAEL
jgi:hypothetical protein